MTVWLEEPPTMTIPPCPKPPDQIRPPRPVDYIGEAGRFLYIFYRKIFPLPPEAQGGALDDEVRSPELLLEGLGPEIAGGKDGRWISPGEKPRDALRPAGVPVQQDDLPGARPPEGKSEPASRPAGAEEDDTAESTSPSRRIEGVEEPRPVRVLRVELPAPDHQGVRRAADLHRLRTGVRQGGGFLLVGDRDVPPEEIPRPDDPEESAKMPGREVDRNVVEGKAQPGDDPVVHRGAQGMRDRVPDHEEEGGGGRAPPPWGLRVQSWSSRFQYVKSTTLRNGTHSR